MTDAPSSAAGETRDTTSTDHVDLSFLTALIGATIAIIAPPIFAVGLLLALFVGEVMFFVGRHREWLRLMLRLALGAAIVVVAALAPTKPIDHIIMEGLPLTPTTVDAFNAANRNNHFAAYRIESDAGQTLIQFSSPQMSLRKFIYEVESSTGKSAHLAHCASHQSILFGSAPIGHSIQLGP